MIEYLENKDIKDLLTKWCTHNMKEIDTFRMKDYEKVFAHIYSFEYVVIRIDEIITNYENSKKVEPETVKFNGKEFKLAVEDKQFEIFTNKWKQLGDIGLNSTERKELNLQYEDYLRLKYAKYKGFIDSICQMSGLDISKYNR